MSSTVINHDAMQNKLRHHFLGWQCRLRQLSIRQAGGQPTVGMRPDLVLINEDGTELEDAGQIIVLLVKAEPEEVTAQFRHMARKTFDPADRYDAAIKFLAAAYYQRAQEFSDRMTALFGPTSQLAAQLITHGQCRLNFSQYNQSYRIPCTVRALAEQDAAYQATYWHNLLFNPNLPSDIRVLQFRPAWAQVEADPPVPA